MLCWARSDGFATNWKDWMGMEAGAGNHCRMEVDSGDTPNFYPTGLPGMGAVSDAGTDMADSNWHLIAVTISASSNMVRLFVDGEQDGSATTSAETGTVTEWRVGSSTDGSYLSSIDSDIDEARFSTVARSTNWIWASYSNQVSGSTFCSYGEAETGEVPGLIVVIDSATMSENGGSSTATVYREGTESNLVVTLISSDTSEATVTNNVTILDGQSNVSFIVSAVDDGILDGVQVVTITALADGHEEGTDTIDVLDDEAALTLVIDSATMSENGGSSSVTVTRTNSTGDVTVNLASDDTTEATVPSSIVISNGQNSAVFTVTAQDDALADGAQEVTITATATGHISDADTITVEDDEFTGMKMKVTFSGYDKAETLINFPALVTLDEGLTNFLYSQFASANGWDLRFKDADEETELNYEVEQWDTNGNSCIWVQVPELTNSAYIWAYWGTPTNAGAPAAYTTNGATWDSDYKAVWHLNETVTDESSGGSHSDSTSGDHHGAQYANSRTDNGIIAGAQSFDGNDCIQIPYTSDLNPASFTVTAWAKRTSGTSIGAVFSSRDDPPQAGYILYNFNGKWEFWTGPGWDQNPKTSTYTLNEWDHVTVTFDGTKKRLYVDGVDSGNNNPASFSVSPGNSLRLGAGQNESSPNFYLACIIDEVRISNVARSTNWVWACWANQVADSTFCEYGAVEAGGGEQTTTNGTPYTWLESYGITNNRETADISDSDGDGALTWQEYRAGTDPTNALSVFRVFDTDFLGTSNRITWYGTTNSGVVTDFIIYRTTNLLSPTWLPVSTNPRSVTGTNIWWDENAPQGVPLFYRPALP